MNLSFYDERLPCPQITPPRRREKPKEAGYALECGVCDAQREIYPTRTAKKPRHLLRPVTNRYKNAKVLLIDDLFKGSISKSDINIMFELINYRYFNKLPVIVSTELSIENLVNIDEALGSRLIEMSKYFLVGIRNKKLNYRIYG